jgi:hypothetical protein
MNGAQFNQIAMKLLQYALLAAQEAVAKHAARGKVMQLLNSGQVKQDLITARQRIALAFELLGVEPAALAQAAAAGENQWRWNGIWQWAPSPTSEAALVRSSMELVRSSMEQLKSCGSSNRISPIDSSSPQPIASAASRDVILE